MMIEKRPDISVVIVNYKTPDLLIDCIESIFLYTGNIELRVIVVDNGSDDESEQLVRNRYDVDWVNMGYNSGFSRANNAGIKLAQANYIVLLNSDTLLTDGCLEKMLDYYRILELSGKVGLLACRMLDTDGNVLYNSNQGFRGVKNIWHENPIIRRWFENISVEALQQRKKDRHSTDHEATWLGAAMVMSSASLFYEHKLYFDENFFMYYEDVEWCYRIRKNGFRNFFYSGTFMFHVNCGSSARDDWKWKQIFVSEMLYLRKTRGRLYFALCVTLILLNNFMERIFLIGKNGIGNQAVLQSKKKMRTVEKLIRRYFFAIFVSQEKMTRSKKLFRYVDQED